MQLSFIFKMIVLSSAAGSIVAVIIFALKSLLKNKLNASWQYFIWFLLIIRLIIPTGFDTPLSKFNVFANTTQRIQTSQNIAGNSSNIKNVVEGNNKILKPNLEKKNNFGETKVKDFNYYVNIASIVWMIGATLILAVMLFSYGMFYLKIRKLSFCQDKEMNEILKESKSIMNISKFIPVVYDGYINTPSLLGVINPKILVDPDLIGKLSFEEKRHIFLHELSHFKRKDIFINWVILFLEIIHWFNPIIWFAFSRMKEDSELACDAYVLSYLNKKEQKEYGETIIELAKFVSGIKLIPGTSGMIKRKSNVKRRIIMIKKFKKNTFKWIGVPVSILAAICMVGITNLPTKAIGLKTQNKLVETVQSKATYVNIVKKFLPKNAQIVTSSNTKEGENVLLKDLNNDGRIEIVSAYKSIGQSEKINIIVLKRIGNNWIKALDEPVEGFKADIALTADIDGDGKDEVLLGRRVGGTLGQLSIYKWNNNTLDKMPIQWNSDVLDKMPVGEIDYSKVDIVDIPGKDMKAIAVWNHDTGNAYMINVLKLNGKTFESADDLCPDYFKQKVVPYYEQKVKEMPKAGFYWYYLADSQIKAGDKKSALKSIEEGSNVATGYPSKEEFNILKEKASK
ncbi:M56 family metallopeptidase [Clostridium sp. AWRP]|uniref:M56 family metallopeptidase n=1 Tax=Clostridium sp. AWRP TaxID=2212991 RepID=UPI000FD9528C|nr:M56 family metallopeptidase [Clostridium sp. AWRP]AZV56854.1 hypothetical protein DMR38_09730 [Clostridium sp. AWRP]